MGPAIVFIIFVLLAISVFLENHYPGAYRSWVGFWQHHGGDVVTGVILLVIGGFFLYLAGWVLWFIFVVFIAAPYSFFKRLFEPRPAQQLEVLPWSQRPFNERFEYASKEVHEILQKMKEYADGYHIVTDDMFSAMREWGLDVYLTYLRKDGYLDDAYNFTYIILQRYIEQLPEIPATSYLQVPLSNLVQPERRGTPYDIPLSKLYDLLVPYVFPQDLKYEGMWIPAEPGSGKTNLLHCMIEDNMAEVAADRASVLIMDSKSNDPNGLVDTWRTIDFKHQWKLEKVYIFDPADKLAINIFDFGDIDQIVNLFEYMLSELINFDLTGYQKLLLTNSIHVIKNSRRPSLLALLDLISKGWQPYVDALRKVRPHVRDFFIDPKADPRSKRLVSDFDSSHYAGTRREVLTRLHALLSHSDKLYDTLVSETTEIDLRKLIDEGSVIIINAKISDLGAKASEFWQRLWTMMLLEAARKRRSRIPVYCYFDEAHRGIARDTKIPEILEELRSANIAVTISHQGAWQIENPKVASALSGLSAIILKSTKDKERGIFTATVRRRSQPLTLHVKEAEARYLKRITSIEDNRRQAETRQEFGNQAPLPALPPIEPVIYEPTEPEYAQAAEPEPEPFAYGRKPVVTDADFVVITPAPPKPQTLPPPKKSIHDDYLC